MSNMTRVILTLIFRLFLKFATLYIYKRREYDIYVCIFVNSIITRMSCMTTLEAYNERYCLFTIYFSYIQ